MYKITNTEKLHWTTQTIESPLDWKEIQPVHPKGNQSWIFIGRTDAEAETPIFWPPDAKNLLEKTLMQGKIEGRRRRAWQDEMVGWHHRLDGHEFEQALGVGDGQGSLQSTESQRVRHDWAPELNWFLQIFFFVPFSLSSSVMLVFLVVSHSLWDFFLPVSQSR